MESNQTVRPYVNLPPVTKARSSSHLVPISPEHQRSASDEGMASSSQASSSQDSDVRFRTESAHILVNNEHEEFYEECVVIYEYTASYNDEINLPLGKTVRLISKETDNPGWWLGEVDGKVGLFPDNYVREVGNIPEYTRDHILFPSSCKGDIEKLRIGQGATAIVYKIELNIDRVSKDFERKEIRMAALKKFKTSYFCQSRHKTEHVLTPHEQMRRESLLMYKLNHNNIVRLYGICLDKEYFGLILELCSGNSLRYLLDNIGTEKTVPFNVMVDWAKQIASGMKYLAQLDYIHRDLKAANVLIREDVCMCSNQIEKQPFCISCGKKPLNQLTLKITDFGVMKKHSMGAERQSSVGTYAWLAPEAFRDHNYTEASDIWSYGVTLWEILSHDLPYRGLYALTVAYHVFKNGQTLNIAEDCPEEWKSIMEKCWIIEPSERPTFAYLEQYFETISKELDDHEVSGKLNNQIKRVQSVMKKELDVIYHRMNNDKTDTYSEANKITKKLYSPIPYSENRISGPKTKDRKHHGKAHKKVGIQDISGPVGDMKHLMSIQRDNSSEKNLKFYYAEENAGGTLSRFNIAKQSNLWSSTPELNITCRRQNAVRYNNRGAHTMKSPVLNNENEFAKIETADEPSRIPLISHKRGGIFNLFENHNRHRTSDEEKEKCGSVGSGDRRKSSSSIISSLFGKTKKKEDSGHSSTNKEYDKEYQRKEIERMAKLGIPSVNSTKNAKDEDLNTLRPSQLPSHRHHGNRSNFKIPRRSPLDQNIPLSPDNKDEVYISVTPSAHNISKTGTDPEYLMLKGDPRIGSNIDPSYEMISTRDPASSMSWRQIPTTSNEAHHKLSSLIPKMGGSSIDEPTHYNMSNGQIMPSSSRDEKWYRGGDDTIDSYVSVAWADSNMSPSKNQSQATTSVANPAYIMCPPQSSVRPQKQSGSSVKILADADVKLDSYDIKKTSTEGNESKIVPVVPPEAKISPEDMYRGLMVTGNPISRLVIGTDNMSNQSLNRFPISPNRDSVVSSPSQSPFHRGYGSSESIVRYWPTRWQQRNSQIARSSRVPQAVFEEEELPNIGAGSRLELARRSCGDVPLGLNSRNSGTLIRSIGNNKFNIINRNMRYGFFASSDIISVPFRRRQNHRSQRLSLTMRHSSTSIREESEDEMKIENEDSETNSNSSNEVRTEEKSKGMSKRKKRYSKYETITENGEEDSDVQNGGEPTCSGGSVYNTDEPSSSASGMCDFESDSLEMNLEKMIGTPKKRLRRRTTSGSRPFSPSGSDFSEDATPKEKGINNARMSSDPLPRTSLLDDIGENVGENDEVILTPSTSRCVPKLEFKNSDDCDSVPGNEVEDEDGNVTIRNIEFSFVEEMVGEHEEGCSSGQVNHLLRLSSSSVSYQKQSSSKRKSLKRRLSDAASRTLRHIRRSLSIARPSLESSVRRSKRKTPISRSPSSSLSVADNVTSSSTQTDISFYLTNQLDYTQVLSADFDGEDPEMTPRASDFRKNDLTEFVEDENR